MSSKNSRAKGRKPSDRELARALRGLHVCDPNTILRQQGQDTQPTRSSIHGLSNFGRD